MILLITVLNYFIIQQFIFSLATSSYLIMDTVRFLCYVDK